MDHGDIGMRGVRALKHFARFQQRNNNNNNKLYLHDYNNILQYCISNLNLTINYLINWYN